MNMIKPLAIVTALAIGGCANLSPGTPTKGFIYQNIKYNHKHADEGIVDSTVAPNKIGRATCVGILGLFSFGNCTEEKAARKSGATKIHATSNHRRSFLGLFTLHTKEVVGE